jgi:hypothetical protein
MSRIPADLTKTITMKTNPDSRDSLANGPVEAGRRTPAHDELDPAGIARWMAQLDRRMRQVESRLATLAGQAADQQEAIGMIGTILRDLDDPYGFGSSLDERLAREGADRTEDEG